MTIYIVPPTPNIYTWSNPGLVDLRGWSLCLRSPHLISSTQGQRQRLSRGHTIDDWFSSQSILPTLLSFLGHAGASLLLSLQGGPGVSEAVCSRFNHIASRYSIQRFCFYERQELDLGLTMQYQGWPFPSYHARCHLEKQTKFLPTVCSSSLCWTCALQPYPTTPTPEAGWREITST